jgi:hypothetical protein
VWKAHLVTTLANGNITQLKRNYLNNPRRKLEIPRILFPLQSSAAHTPRWYLEASTVPQAYALSFSGRNKNPWCCQSAGMNQFDRYLEVQTENSFDKEATSTRRQHVSIAS